MVLRTALWCVPVADLGGVARHVLDAARTGVPGWRIVVLCPEGPLAERLRALGVPVLVGPVSPDDGTRAAVAAIRDALRRLRPDVLHTHLAFADLAGIAAVQGLRSGRGERIRVVSTEHGIAGVRGYYQASEAAARAKAAAHRARLLRTDRIIAVSESTREQVAAQWGSAEKIVVVRNEVEAPGAAADSAGTGTAGGAGTGAAEPRPGLRILSLARLAPEKRIDELLRAFVHVLRGHPEATLTIAGTGPEEASLRARAGILGLAGHVDFVGHVDAADALRRHDVVVQLSVWENLSYTLLDAVAHGLGVVATDVGGNGEIVPERCLVASGGGAGAPGALPAEEIARRIVEQGLEVGERPGRRALVATSTDADSHGTLPGMCAAIAVVYDAALGGGPL